MMTKLVADKLKTAPLTSTEVGKGLRIRKFRATEPRAVKIIEHNSFLSAITIPPFSRRFPISSWVSFKDKSAFSNPGFSVNKEDSNISFPDEIIGESDSCDKVGVSDPDFGEQLDEIRDCKVWVRSYSENCFFSGGGLASLGSKLELAKFNRLCSFDSGIELGTVGTILGRRTKGEGPVGLF